MALPSSFSAKNAYLNEAFEFLKEFEWIYTTSNTEFIAAGTLDRIPNDWIEIIDKLSLEELNEIPFDYSNDSWPLSFRQFLATIKRLKPVYEASVISIRPEECEQQFLKGIKPKKIHEIQQLSKEILQNCGCLSDAIFIDIGCGVGHLTNFLSRKFQYKILGIEADLERIRTAEKLQKSKFPESVDKVKFVQHYIESSSDDFIQSFLMKEFHVSERTELVLTGLHACADLTISALRLFLNIANVRRMLIMPCCYHKMKLKIKSLKEFENIPLSQGVRAMRHARDIINRPFLRLAGQQTAARWRNVTEAEHRIHGENMFLRGAVQAVLNEDEAVIKDSKKYPSDDTLSQYTLLNKHTRKETSWSNEHKLAFMQVTSKYPNGGGLSEFLTCLQASIQSICENVVLLDRILYVEEEAMRLKLDVNISVKKIVNEEISPRCFVIIAEKNKEI